METDLEPIRKKLELMGQALEVIRDLLKAQGRRLDFQQNQIKELQEKVFGS